MACGCPVIVSSAGALPEVVGDAGLLVDPDNQAGLREPWRCCLDDGAARAELIRRGLRRAAGFSWQRAAAETRRIYQAVFGG
jgi:glycosyltransferase involved in cell wall biosynthesis